MDKNKVLPIWLATLLVASALATSHVSDVFAYSLLGGRWPNQPTSGCCAHLYVEELNSYSYDGAGWDNGRGAWNNSAANIFYYTTGTSSIVLTDTSNNSVAWDGLTQLSPCNSCTYSSSTSWLNQYYTINYSTGEIQSVAAHELGHVGGLGHSSGCVLMVGDTYTRWVVCGVNIPQTDDVNGMNAIY